MSCVMYSEIPNHVMPQLQLSLQGQKYETEVEWVGKMYSIHSNLDFQAIDVLNKIMRPTPRAR